MATGTGNRKFAIIAGTGFQELASAPQFSSEDNRFGRPSSPIRTRRIGSQDVAVLARHGEKMSIPPHAINYRANLQALHDAGVSDIIALNTVGVISAGKQPGQLAVPAQLIDYTSGREHSIYSGSGNTLDHIDFSCPFTPDLRRSLLDAAVKAGVEVVDGGIYAVTNGPRLETIAEVNRLERDGVDYVGMTAMPEASLARELGLTYACVSLIVNFAAGRGGQPIHEDIEMHTVNARRLALRVVDAFFGNPIASFDE